VARTKMRSVRACARERLSLLSYPSGRQLYRADSLHKPVFPVTPAVLRDRVQVGGSGMDDLK
jgi:hypothetical protein